MRDDRERLLSILDEKQDEVLDDWIEQLQTSPLYRQQLMGEGELREHCQELLTVFHETLRDGARIDHVHSAEWDAVRSHLTDNVKQLVQLGYKPAEAAAIVLALKRPLFSRLTQAAQKDEGREGVGAIWSVGHLLDQLALWKAEVVHRNQQDTIRRQQEELMELSTPVVQLWDGVLALPLIGTLDTARTQVVMESLLEKIVETRSQVAIIDITGVPTVDTMVAQHLIKAVTAARLMGADCIISGIRPLIAQTMVQLGVELNDITTKATLADAMRVALQRRGLSVQRQPGAGQEPF